ncbi:hypothetical protein NHQ30_008373 [Ciborinia camelliae]|nr:hypothetical protein NHQ30_008373 [Ciborinia camelliae]
MQGGEDYEAVDENRDYYESSEGSEANEDGPWHITEHWELECEAIPMSPTNLNPTPLTYSLQPHEAYNLLDDSNSAISKE